MPAKQQEPMMEYPRLICAATTPFLADGTLDQAGLRPAFEGLRQGGVADVFTPGTTGEFTTLEDAERLAVIEAALAVFGPQHVYAHVGAASERQAVALAVAAARLGARRFGAITPYFVKAGPAAVFAYYRSLTQAVPKGMFFPYLFKASARTEVTPAALAELATLPGIVGAKLSGLDATGAMEYVAAVPDGFPIYSGNDREALRFVLAGGRGAVSGVSAVFTAPFVAAMAAAGHEQSADSIGRLQDGIDRACDLTLDGHFGLLKAGVAARGLPSGPLRMCVEAPPAEAVRRLREAVGAANAVNTANPS
ncbi:MAG: dihydrodipicolinate synthase family protein [Bifidobacteriaceae bacterium]|nr:dihydrodipicolinate synthase family protein [Bifidobacteriaceae bacterium]